jgi:hypothetical protein
MTFGTCPTFTPCGGDEVGSWKVSGGCLSDAILTDAKTACPGFTTSNEVIKAKGTVDLDGTNVVQHTSVKLTADAFIPFAGDCAATTNCQLLAAGAKLQLGFDQATCTDHAGGGGCDCTVEKTNTTNANDSYTKSSNTITTGGGDSYDYCVAGSKLTYTQTSGQNPPPLYIELSK